MFFFWDGKFREQNKKCTETFSDESGLVKWELFLTWQKNERMFHDYVFNKKMLPKCHGTSRKKIFFFDFLDSPPPQTILHCIGLHALAPPKTTKSPCVTFLNTGDGENALFNEFGQNKITFSKSSSATKKFAFINWYILIQFVP